MPHSGRDPVVSKNHTVSLCDILLSLVKIKEQEGAGPTISSLYKKERDTLKKNINMSLCDIPSIVYI
jgi:hypothetical protein